MSGLILKDIVVTKKSLIWNLIFIIIFNIYAIYQDYLILIPFISIFLSLILSQISIGYDMKSEFEKMLFSMPAKRSTYVTAKLFFPLIFGIISSIILFCLLMIRNNMPIAKSLLISIIALVISILLPAIQQPFIYKFGEHRGRLIMFITYFLVFFSANIFKDAEIVSKFALIYNRHSFGLISLGIIAVGILCIMISILISIKILDKKEY